MCVEKIDNGDLYQDEELEEQISFHKYFIFLLKKIPLRLLKRIRNVNNIS